MVSEMNFEMEAARIRSRTVKHFSVAFGTDVITISKLFNDLELILYITV
jgi:hypothetical protein